MIASKRLLNQIVLNSKHNIENPPILRIKFDRGMETSGCYVAELDKKVVGVVAYEKKVYLYTQYTQLSFYFANSKLAPLIIKP